MHTDVQRLVSRWMVCDRVKASFNAPTPQLHPLLLMGLGYRWSLDFAGPLPLTIRHNIYVLVMVEHFSKWIELVSSPDKSSKGVACRAPKFLVDPLEGPSMRQCGSGWNLGHDPNF
jgi:hypothetical protein